MNPSLRPRLIILLLFLVLLVILGTIIFLLQKADTTTGEGIFAGVVANVITTFTFTILGIGTLIGIFVTERQALFRFFGINGNIPSIRIYVSRVEVLSGGSKGAESITIGYVGPTIIHIEYLGARLVRSLFRSRVLALLPERLRDLLSAVHVTFSDIDPIIDVSPKTLTEDVLSDNLILIGSGVYNYVSLCYLSQPLSPFYFDKDAGGERVVKVRRKGKDLELGGRASNQELGIIERINDTKHGTAVFVCAGLGSSASYGCVRYLVRNWKKIQRHYGQDEFAFCLEFENQPPDSDSENVVEPKIIHEVPRTLQ